MAQPYTRATSKRGSYHQGLHADVETGSSPLVSRLPLPFPFSPLLPSQRRRLLPQINLFLSFSSKPFLTDFFPSLLPPSPSIASRSFFVRPRPITKPSQPHEELTSPTLPWDPRSLTGIRRSRLGEEAVARRRALELDPRANASCFTLLHAQLFSPSSLYLLFDILYDPSS